MEMGRLYFMTVLIHLIRDHITCSTSASADWNIRIFGDGCGERQSGVKKALKPTRAFDRLAPRDHGMGKKYYSKAKRISDQGGGPAR